MNDKNVVSITTKVQGVHSILAILLRLRRLFVCMSY